MELLQNILVGLLLLAGGGFAFFGAVGVLRFPDVYTRMHAASKSGTVGSGLLLLAVAVYAGDLGVAIRCLAAIVFLLLTAPVAAHLLSRAAYLAGYKPDPSTRLDAYGPALRRQRRSAAAAENEPG
ncbi:monovalent cation/H(+) antiporter subunit G [Methylobrevis albus]|uniref:Monovalent cation/H(+) antiporter subunit G n=1 Tax=Methylobrevis albus TaxID=2793297 RepID=A0A931HYN6_9HYPH|nr:monovalent cation/H(+) antiporter subunit G [Methylobrevis albus]MBH0237107.1 monovalent cation/H(+) antiporter subunit G [Methylobrevis albus]